MRLIARSGDSDACGRPPRPNGRVAGRRGATVKRWVTRVKRIAESPRAKELGRKLTDKAQDPAARARISDGVRKLTRRKA